MRRTLPSLLSFPDPVNEHAARLVAAGVVAMAATVVVGRQHWVLVPLAYGFLARVATGPRLSPLGRLVTGVVVPRLGWTPRPVPGRPKRFAQGIGAVLSVSALGCWLAGAPGVATVLAALILVAASLEAGAGLCLGCIAYGWLARLGILPDACPDCTDLSLRRPATAPAAAARPPA